MKKREKVYQVTWTQKHKIDVRATNKEEAIETGTKARHYDSFEEYVEQDAEIIADVYEKRQKEVSQNDK